uniref:Uncharacterized protein n=1 Tax=Klebsiella pneumoniae TaxID=573 RepID=A0A8B0SR49_KLEPN|nr:hypothetical protein [Klebsiella pneumoniae]
MVAYLLKHFQVTMGASMLKMKLEKGASRVLSSGDRDKLNYIRENMPVGSPKRNIRKCETSWRRC